MAKKFLDNTGLSHLINLIQGMPDDQTIGYTTETGLHVLDGSITPNKISSLQQLRYEMGLGNTLGALPIENGGTGLTSEAAIKEWLESLLDLSGGGGGSIESTFLKFNAPQTYDYYNWQQADEYCDRVTLFGDSPDVGWFSNFKSNVNYIEFPYTGTYSVSITGNLQKDSTTWTYTYIALLWNRIESSIHYTNLTSSGGRPTQSYYSDRAYDTGSLPINFVYDNISINKGETLALYFGCWGVNENKGGTLDVTNLNIQIQRLS